MQCYYSDEASYRYLSEHILCNVNCLTFWDVCEEKEMLSLTVESGSVNNHVTLTDSLQSSPLEFWII